MPQRMHVDRVDGIDVEPGLQPTAASGRSGSLLQVSDPHFGTEQPGAVDALVALVARRRPALVVLSGDITQRATTEQFAAARAFVDRLAPVPVLAVPGNHDIPLFAFWERLVDPYRRYARAFGPAVDRWWSNDHWHVTALNTTRWWRHKNGEVSAVQVAATAAALRAAPPQAVKVVVTHQPLAVQLEIDRTNLLRGHARAASVWHGAGADLLMGGHIHLPYIQPLAGPASDPPLWVLQAGTALSTRVRNSIPNSVTEVLPPSATGPGSPRRCSVCFWDWTPGGTFVARPAVELALALRPV